MDIRGVDAKTAKSAEGASPGALKGAGLRWRYQFGDLKNPTYAMKDARGKPNLLHIVKDDDGTLHLAE